MAEEKTKDYAIGHRERVRRKFLENGFNGFEDYEVLELLLFYVIPRRDTKAIAKELIKKFKNLANVLKADNKELKTINGLGDVAITWLIGKLDFILLTSPTFIPFLLSKELASI